MNWHVGAELVVLDEKTMQNHLFSTKGHRLYLYPHLWFHIGTFLSTVLRVMTENWIVIWFYYHKFKFIQKNKTHYKTNCFCI